MDPDDFKQNLEVLLQQWEWEISQVELDSLVAKKLQPLLSRIESLENQLTQAGASRGTAHGSGPAVANRDFSGTPPGAARPPLRNRRIVPANPYEIPAGRELDALVQQYVMKLPKQADDCPRYSTEMSETKKVLGQLKSAFDTPVISGRTSIAGRSWFARFATTSNHGTEVLADSLPLAICRVALLVVEQNERRAVSLAGE